MRRVQDLIEAARDARLRSQPKWVQELVHDLAHRMEAEHTHARIAREAAEREVAEARLLLTSGPEDSDTFVDLPRAVSTYAYEAEQRPLGKGASVEFRQPGLMPGEGFTVQWAEDGTLQVSGISTLAVIPQNTLSIKIETR